MGKLQSPQDLIDYAKRALGHPVINIELDDQQCLDRVDECIKKFIKSHYDGVTEEYILHKVTASEAATGKLNVSSNVVAVLEILESGEGQTSVEEFERLTWHLAQTDIWRRVSKGGSSEYYLKMTQLELIKDLFSPSISFYHNQTANVLAIRSQLMEGNIIVYKAYVAIDPDFHIDVYDNEWVRRYTTQLIKKQWGSNIKKYDGVPLPGGQTLNGQQIFDEAVEALRELDEEFEEKYEYPIDFFTGPSWL